MWDYLKSCDSENYRLDNGIFEQIIKLQQEKKDLESKLTDQTTILITIQQNLDQLKSELTKKGQELDSLKTQLEQKNTNRKNWNSSSGLLTQQVEHLTQQLSETQQKEEKVRLEGEIRANLLREQGEQIHSYQQLLRTSEENLSNCQQIISQKSEQLENLEREKNLIAEELD